MHIFEKISKGLAKACFWVACLALICMALQMSLDVTLRRFGIYMEGTLEATSFYYMIFAVFLGFSYTQYKDKHISTDILVNLLPQTVAKVLDKFSLLIQFLLYALLTYQTTIDAFNSLAMYEEAMANFTFYVWPAKFALPIGFLSITLVVLLQMFTNKQRVVNNG